MSHRISEKIKKRIKKTDQISSDLDKRCTSLLYLFSVLYARNPEKRYGFNELYRIVGKEEIVRAGFTRQTLSVHLKHLLGKELIEVREEKESNLKIKPRKYRLSKYFARIVPDLQPLLILYDEELLKEYRFLETEPLTLLLLRAYMRLCVEIFRKTLAFPEFYGMYQRDYVYSCIENLTKAHRAIVFERDESETALRIVEEFGDFVKQKLIEKYGPL